MSSFRLLIVGCAAALLIMAACQSDPTAAKTNLKPNPSPLDSATLTQLEAGIKLALKGDTLGAEKIRKDIKADNLPADSTLAMFFHRLGGAYHHPKVLKLDKAIVCYLKALDLWDKRYSEPNKRTSFTLYNLGNCYHYTFEFGKSHEYLQRALAMQAKIFEPNDPNLADTYREIGSVYEEETDYFNALIYLKKAVSNYNINLNTSQYLDWARAYNLIGVTSRQIRDYKQAVFYYQKSIDIALQGQIQNQDSTLKAKCQLSAGHSFNNLGNVLRDSGNYDAALAAYRHSLALQTVEQEDTYLDMAHTFWLKKQPKEAIAHLTKAKILCQQKDAPIEAASVENLSAEIFLAESKSDSALSATEAALQFLLPKYTPNIPLSIETFETALSRSELIETLDLRAKAFAKKFEQTKNTADLAASLTTYTATDALINDLLNSLNNDESRYFWTESVNKIYENAIKTALRLFDLTQQTDYQNAALTFAANGKAFTLRNTLKNNRALQFADVPKDALAQEQTLKANLAFWQKQYSTQRDSSPIATAFLEAKQKFTDFQKSMENQFPRYYQLKYAPNAPLSILSIQQQLAADMLAVEYFLGDSSLYIFGISPTQTCFIQEKLTPDFLQNIQTLRQSISGNWQETNQTAESAYLKSAHWLYKSLLERPLSILNASGKHNRLRIVTDGVLGYIPFDALISKLEPNTNWRSADWLMRQYAVSYATSNSHLNDPSVKSATARHFSGFGISYTQNPTATMGKKALAPLPDAPIEVSKIYENLGKNGSLNLENKATKAHFMQQAPKADVLHLAMHGYIDEQNPLNSGLIFSPQNVVDTSPYLTGFDLYGLKLDAHLAVLSACQTGDGKLQRHEGVMSLARSFVFAGCRSIVMSLWQIPDRSTADIMSNFYDQLKTGVPKDVALQRAKLDFLQQCPPSQRTPERWAACVVIGDVVPLTWASSWIWIAVLAGLVFCLIGWWIWRKRER